MNSAILKVSESEHSRQVEDPLRYRHDGRTKDLCDGHIYESSQQNGEDHVHRRLVDYHEQNGDSGTGDGREEPLVDGVQSPVEEPDEENARGSADQTVEERHD